MFEKSVYLKHGSRYTARMTYLKQIQTKRENNGVIVPRSTNLKTTFEKTI